MEITVSSTIRTPHAEIRALVQDGFADVLDADVEVHVKARGLRRSFVVLCDRSRCPLPHNYRARTGTGEPPGRGHHFAASLGRAEAIARRHRSPLLRRVAPRGRGFSGRAYNGVPGIARVGDGVRFLVTIMMPAAPDAPTARRYPYRWRYARYVRARPVLLQSWQEELVHLAAHEARHVAQFRAGRPASELDAEAWAAAVLADWDGAPNPLR
jgi:hypothetical protein